MMDWLGRMLQLPECFIAETHGHGGGVIQVSVIGTMTLSVFYMSFCRCSSASVIFFVVALVSVTCRKTKVFIRTHLKP